VQEGDAIRIPPMRMSTPAADEGGKPSIAVQQLLQKRIIYEDDELLVINKPSGMAVHGGSGVSFGVIEIMRHMRPQAKLLELVHRIDRDTSGCLLLAKKASVLKELHELIRQGNVQKIYLTLVKGQWPKHIVLVDAPLKKYELQSGERMVNVSKEGKSAQTEFRVIKRLANATLLEAKLLTGRTHQIRVHTAHIGHPIAGDEKYGDKEFNKQIRAQGCKRLFLHAYQLDFVLPATGKHVQVAAPLDADLQKFLESNH